MSDNAPTLQQLQANFAQAQRKITELATQNARLKAPKNPEPVAKPVQETSFLNIPKIQAKGLDTDSLQAQFLANGGQLTDATRKALTAKGFDPDLIATMQDAYRTKVETQTKAAAQILGSEQELQKFVSWASTLPKAQKDQLNRGLRGPSWQKVLKGFNDARLQDSKEGGPAVNTQGRTNQQPSFTKDVVGESDAFANPTEQNRAIQNKHYATNHQGYRDKVMKRVRATQQYGFKDFRNV